MSVYWGKLAVNIAMLASVACVVIYGIRAGMQPEQIVAVILPLYAAAMQMLPAIDKAKTTFPTGRPPAYEVRVPTIPSPPPDMVIIPPPPNAAPKGTP